MIEIDLQTIFRHDNPTSPSRSHQFLAMSNAPVETTADHLDVAIRECEDYCELQLRSARRLLIYLAIIGCCALYVFWLYSQLTWDQRQQMREEYGYLRSTLSHFLDKAETRTEEAISVLKNLEQVIVRQEQEHAHLEGLEQSQAERVEAERIQAEGGHRKPLLVAESSELVLARSQLKTTAKTISDLTEALRHNAERIPVAPSAVNPQMLAPEMVVGKEPDDSKIIIATLVMFTIVFCVLMALYRYHLSELSRTVQYKMGFVRIRIAAESQRKGYQSEVRAALTNGAFAVDGPTRKSRGAIESPIPGHPTSDLTARLLNKIMDAVEVKIKPSESSAESKANGD